jgi:acetyl-CoA carboxylase biotin carboxyl carrier protein
MTDAFDQPPDAGTAADPMIDPIGEPQGAIDTVVDPAVIASEGADIQPAAAVDPGDASLLGLIDRLGSILERSDLTEIEVGAGQTTVIIRKPVAVAMPSAAAPAADNPSTAAAATGSAAETGRDGAPSGGKTGSAGAQGRPSVKAPLTGIWYASPTPGSAPFVEVGRELAVGQVVGLIEAMKLFNEIKSDLAGRVVRVVADSGTLVKAKQPLIEVEPL